MIKNYAIKLTLLLVSLFSLQSTKAQEFLFYCSNETGTYQAYKKDLSTNSIVALTKNSNYNYWWVEPSPNHKSLLMMRSPVGAGINDQFDYDSCQMLKTDIKGNQEVILVDHHQNGWTAFGNPHWHPNGNRILMLAQPTAEFFVFTIDTLGNNPKKLTHQYSLDPNWSPNGSQVVFIGINSAPTFPASFDDFEVFISDYNYTTHSLSGIKQLTNDTLRDHDPCFSPDGSQIAFSSGVQTLLDANIVVIDTNGINRTNLVDDNTTNGGPVNWGVNNTIYYHQVHLFVTPFTAKSYTVGTSSNTNLFPSITAGYISPFYAKLSPMSSLIPKPSSIKMSIYPNPVTSKQNLIIRFEKKIHQGLIQIIDLSGKVVFRQNRVEESTSVNLTHLNAGVYFVQVQVSEKNCFEKLVIEE